MLLLHISLVYLLITSGATQVQEIIQGRPFEAIPQGGIALTSKMDHPANHLHASGCIYAQNVKDHMAVVNVPVNQRSNTPISRQRNQIISNNTIGKSNSLCDINTHPFWNIVTRLSERSKGYSYYRPKTWFSASSWRFNKRYSWHQN